MQTNSILNDFESARNSIIDSVFKYMKKVKNQSLFLSESPSYRVADKQLIIKHIYKKLFIKENELYIEYEYGEGFEPYEYKIATEELWMLSANEIYEVIRRMDKY